MRWRRIFGIFLLFAALLLAVLLSAKVPFFKTNKFSINNPIEVPSNGDTDNFYNITLEPQGKEGYRVSVTVSPYNKPMEVDFWAVNESGLGILAASLSYGELFMPQYYANERPFVNIKWSAREINITTTKQFDLVNLDHNGKYCLVLLNFFGTPQNVSVSVEEQYIESFHTFLEPNLANFTVTSGVFAASTYLIVTGGSRSARKMKRQTRKT